MRLIDADKLADKVIQDMAMTALHGETKYWSIVLELAEAFKTTLDNAPTIDAEVVVRCGDCKHEEKSSCPMRSRELVEDYVWCYYGERKEK